MLPMAPHGGASMGLPAWQEHRTPDGRSYYYNAATKVTQWTKPEELMAPAEVSPAADAPGVSPLLTRRSAPLPTSPGRNTRPKAGGSTGTTPKQSRALGRCRMRTSQLLQPTADRQLPRKSPSSFRHGGMSPQLTLSPQAVDPLHSQRWIPRSFIRSSPRPAGHYTRVATIDVRQ